MTDSSITEQITENQKASRFGLTDLIGTIWGVHVLIAALLYPRPLLPSEEEVQKQQLYKTISLLFGTFILFVNIACIIVMFSRPTLVDAAKVFFVFLAWIMIGTIYILFNHLRDICSLFSILEDEALQGRDESVMLIRAAQAALQAGNKKLLYQEEEIEMSFASLLRKVGPLALLFMRKETNLLQIGIEAFKLFFVGSRLFKTFF